MNGCLRVNLRAPVRSSGRDNCGATCKDAGSGFLTAFSSDADDRVVFSAEMAQPDGCGPNGANLGLYNSK